MTQKDFLDFVDYNADRRLEGLGLPCLSSIKNNPFVWLDEVIFLKKRKISLRQGSQNIRLLAASKILMKTILFKPAKQRNISMSNATITLSRTFGSAMTSPFPNIIRRDLPNAKSTKPRVVPWNGNKIEKAVDAACRELSHEPVGRIIQDAIENRLIDEGPRFIHIEQLQDMVEDFLINSITDMSLLPTANIARAMPH
nr:hypothetical protein OJOKFFHK_00012 [uncultured bacterium]